MRITKKMLNETFEGKVIDDKKQGLARGSKNEFNIKFLYSMVLENRFIKSS